MTHLDDNAICDPTMRVAEITHRKISSAQHSRKVVQKPKNWMRALNKINECTPRVNER